MAVRRIHKSLSALLLAALLLLAVGCGGSTDGGGQGAATRVPETETVDLTDTRQLTDTSDYVARLNDAFANIQPVPEEQLTYTVDAAGATLTGYVGTAELVVIPETLGGQPVVAVAEGAFAGGGLQALSLPDTVQTIAPGGLSGCSGLILLRLPVTALAEQDSFGSLFGSTTGYLGNTRAVPASLSTLILTEGDGEPGVLPDSCFYGCTGLEAVELSDTLTSLPRFAFYGCSKLAYLSLPVSLEQIGSYAFANCTSLLGLTLPASLLSVGGHMLEGCGRIEQLTLPFVGGQADGDTAYLGYLFGAEHHTLSEGFLPSSLQRVELLPGCTAIPPNAFYECSRLREVILPDSVTEIGYRAFYRCAYLAGMDLPAGLTALGDEAFSGCVRLTAIDLSALHSTDDWGIQTFRGCLSLKQVTMSDALTGRLPSGTFAGCRALDQLIGASGELELDESAFRGCPVYKREGQTE